MGWRRGMSKQRRLDRPQTSRATSSSLANTARGSTALGDASRRVRFVAVSGKPNGWLQKLVLIFAICLASVYSTRRYSDEQPPVSPQPGDDRRLRGAVRCSRRDGLRGLRRLLEQPDAPRTVSGHDPPAGSHSNIISASINGTDLAMGAVSGRETRDRGGEHREAVGQLGQRSEDHQRLVTGNDMDRARSRGRTSTRRRPGSLGVPAVVAAAAAGDPPVTLFHHGNLTLTGHCISDDRHPRSWRDHLESAAADAALLSVDGFTGRGSRRRRRIHWWRPELAYDADPRRELSVLSLSGDYLEGRVQVAVDWDDFPSAVPFCAYTFSGATEGA